MAVAPLVGAWIETCIISPHTVRPGVTPLVGAWIETYHVDCTLQDILSHPSWVRGLKLAQVLRVGRLLWVAPLVGAWIETLTLKVMFTKARSHPSWVRGLKLEKPE